MDTSDQLRGKKKKKLFPTRIPARSSSRRYRGQLNDWFQVCCGCGDPPTNPHPHHCSKGLRTVMLTMPMEQRQTAAVDSTTQNVPLG